MMRQARTYRWQFSAMSPMVGRHEGARSSPCVAKAKETMLRSRTTPVLRGALRRLSTFDDVTPMTIADRVEQAAVRKGVFAGLPGRGKPLPDEDPDSQVHVAQLSKNIEGRARQSFHHISIS